MCRPAWAQARIAALHLSGLTELRRVRDRIGREYAQPLDLDALASDVGMSAGQLTDRFGLAYAESPYDCLMRRRTEQAMGRGPKPDLTSLTPGRVAVIAPTRMERR